MGVTDYIMLYYWREYFIWQFFYDLPNRKIKVLANFFPLYGIVYQELMSTAKECQTSKTNCYRMTLQKTPYTDFELHKFVAYRGSSIFLCQ